MESHKAPDWHYSEKAVKPKVLIVDDDEMVRDVLAESVKLAGCDTDVCRDGWEALEMANKEPYDLIVTDMRLPGLDGLSLIRRLGVEGKDTDVIVITGYGTIENAVECMKAGALEYIIKPFTVDQIVLAVKKAMEHRELRRRAVEGDYYRELSYLDPLTEIYNRRYFDEALVKEIDKSIRQATSVSLLMIDIDDFKIYNDSKGHQKGDMALKQIGHVLTKTCRTYDIVSRYGGEEFTLIVPGEGKNTAYTIALRIARAIEAEQIGPHEELNFGHLTVSIGIASCPEDAINVEDLIHCADVAMYKAKKAGKNRIEIYKRE